MFDSNTNTTNLKINAVSGIMVKNYRKSFMLRFQIKSGYEKLLFNNEPSFYVGRSDKMEPVVIIQVMILPDDNYLAEIMWKKDFDEMFKEQEERG